MNQFPILNNNLKNNIQPVKFLKLISSAARILFPDHLCNRNVLSKQKNQN